MRQLKNFSTTDMCILALYLAITHAICVSMYCIASGIINNEINLTWHDILTLILLLFLFILGITTLFRRGLVRYFFHKYPELHSSDNLEYHAREGAIYSLFFCFSLLLISTSILYGYSWLSRAGTVMRNIGAIIFILHSFYERMESW